MEKVEVMSCKIKSRSKIASGDWLYLENIEYSDLSGKIYNWESAMRVKGQGAVAVIATMQPSGAIILVRQFRPPADGYVIEFPAGLIDDGEFPEVTAVRELREETGYHSSVVEVLPPMFSSPGLSGETVAMVLSVVDENAPENQKLVTDFDDTEDIETFIVKRGELQAFLKERKAAGDLLDSKVVSYMLGSL
jgi:8-oxo-dGTP pyrophosphatase MutT (NUDIX family)